MIHDTHKVKEIREKLLMELKQNYPVYTYIDPRLGDEISPFWISEVAQAVATLYVGYQLGSQIEDVGKALARTIDAIGDIARSIAHVIDKLGEIIDAIAKALEAINRKIDSAFMQQHLSDMKAASLTIFDIITRLQTLPHDQNDARVANNLLRLQMQLDALFRAIIRYLNQENGSPSPAALIGCAPSIALWAQTYTVIERYQAIEDRIPPWKTSSQSEIKSFITSFFDDYINQRSVVIDELNTTYLRPTSGQAFEFQNSHFYLSSTKYEKSYPYNPKYFGLYTSIPWLSPFNIYSTYIYKGYDNEPAPHPIPIPISMIGWKAVTPRNVSEFPNPDQIIEALKWDEICGIESQKRWKFLAETDKFDQYKLKALDAMKEDPGW